ncbi:hypothetical protein R3P38DRAFT_1464518 [Favolaschia claudopus]|uniref:EF-hand domain-containing protein n=1 Tax=Favolaschia claudopus TaxID=2862362 RepID=A0AAW0DM57_9AGAR
MSHAPQALDIRVSHADVALRNTKELIERHKPNQSKKESSTRIRKILSGIQQVVGVLEVVASLDPRAQAAVTVFKGLIKLENDRRDNDERFLAVHVSMTLMMFALRRLPSVQEQNSDELVPELDAIAADMEEFGTLTDSYWNKCNKFVRFIRSTDFKEKLEHYDDTFSKHGERLTRILVAEMAPAVAEIQINVREVLDRLTNAQNQREEEAQNLLREGGGLAGVLENQDLLKAIAAKLGEQVTPAISHVLKQTLDSLIEENGTQFASKLENVKKELDEAIQRSTQVIIGRLNEGAYQIIQDVDIREIWREDKWKLSVKWRTFVDGVCNHFHTKFKKMAAESGGFQAPEEWTLQVMSNVAYHSPIGEAIDEDASGFISVHEINHFIERKGDLSTPVWLAYWAAGHQYLNLQYTTAVDSLLSDVRAACEHARSDLDEMEAPAFEGYLATIQLLQYIVDWVDVVIDGDSEFDIMADLDEAAQSELDVVVTEFSEKNERSVEKALEALNFELLDRASIGMVTNDTGVRIEQVILLLLYTILPQNLKMISEPEDQSTEPDDAGDWRFSSKWQQMDASLTTLMFDFHLRMRSLIRGWRSQKLDVKLQMHSYSGGLYAGWYEEYIRPGSKIVELVERAGNGPNGDSDDVPQTGDTVDEKIHNLVVRINEIDDKLESRLSQIEDMLRQVLHTSAQGADIEPPQMQVPAGYYSSEAHEGDVYAGAYGDESDTMRLGQMQASAEYSGGED